MAIRGTGPIPPRCAKVVPMATAVVLGYASEGFALAADGLEVEGEKETNWRLQKIFPVRGTSEGTSLAYAMMGDYGLGDRRDTTFKAVFDFSQAYADEMKATNTDGFNSLHSYMNHISTCVGERLLSVCEVNPFIQFPSQEQIVTFFMVGYFSGKPERATASFVYRNGDLGLEEVSPRPTELGNRFYGSPVIEKMLDEDEAFRDQFQQVLPVARRHKSENVNLLIEEALRFIAACSSPEAKKRDPVNCKAIGGDPQVAIITREDGFQWVPGFERGG